MRLYLQLSFCALLALIAFALTFYVILPELQHGGVAQQDLRFDEEVDRELSASSDLKTDIGLMWSTVLFEEACVVSPVSSINAASRVFARLEESFIGKHISMVEEQLNFTTTRETYYYSTSFFPPELSERSRVFRFDCGYFGWQFVLLLDKNKCVSRVKRQWIH